MQGQALRSLALSPSPYVVLALCMAGTLLTLSNTLQVIDRGYLIVLFEPFVAPVEGACLLAAMFVAFVTALTVARERESGTLEVLFYGPITHQDYLLAKTIAHLTAYVAMLLIYMAGLQLLALLTHLRLSLSIVLIAVSSVAAAAGFIGLAALVASVMCKVRSTLLTLVGLVLALLGLQAGQMILTGIVSGQQSLGFVLLRDTLSMANAVASWLWPLPYLLRAAEAALHYSWGEWAAYTVGAVCYGALALRATAVLLRQRGVIR